MSSKAERQADTIERIQRERAESELGWLRRGRVDLDWRDAARRFLSDEGTAEATDALRERTWTRPEQEAFVRQRAELAFHVELAAARPLFAALSSDAVALPFGTEGLATVVRGLWSEGSVEGKQQRARALGDTARELAPRLIELRGRALAAFEEQQQALPLPAPDPLLHPPSPPNPKPAPVPPPSAASTPAKSPSRLAAEFLDRTADATRELTRWLVRPAAVSGGLPYHLLVRGLRAPELDGLARPTRRLARVAHGLRALGFERDMNARVRAEAGEALFEPRARVLAPAVPSNVRVVQSTLDFGVLSDVYGAQGVGEALALALVSPALPVLLRRPTEAGVAGAFGFAYLQLRAEREFLRRVEQLEPSMVERLARHAGIVVLLETRLQAALLGWSTQPARSDNERVQQLTAAVEAALGVELPASLAVLAGWSAVPGFGSFEACAAGLAVHVALRGRFDADWFRNPRVSEVLRGAATRGTTLSTAALLQELGVSADVSIERSIELLG